MALLSVSEVLSDPDFSEIFSIRRRTQVIDAKGRSTAVETLLTGCIGVITSSDPNDLDRGDPDYELAHNNISVITDFVMYGAMEGLLPDIVVWRGVNYTVNDINQYPQFGPGFIQANCASTDRNDKMPSTFLSGQAALNVPSNSYIAGLL